MNKKSILWVLLDSVFFIVFNVIFFVIIGTEHNAAGWISYAFIILAYILLIATPFMIRKSKSRAVFGFSLYSISAVYFLIELIVGIVFILVTSISFKTAFLVQIILFGLYAVLLISHMIANEATAKSEEKKERDIQYVKNNSMKLKNIMESVSDKKIKKKIEKAYDIVSTSPVGSSDRAREMEEQVSQMVDRLELAVDNNDESEINALSDKIVSKANERNRRVRS